MLDTLYAIGKEMDRDAWEDIILVPKPKNKDDKFRLYNLKIVFDLDQQQVLVLPEHLEAFSESVEHLKAIGNLKIQQPRSRCIGLSYPVEKIEQLTKTLFGKKESSSKKGELLEAIEKEANELKETTLYQMLSAIYPLQENLNAYCWNSSEKTYDPKLLHAEVKLTNTDRLVLVYAAVTSAQHQLQEKPLAQVEGYVSFIEKKFFTNNSTGRMISKLCYATGNYQDDVKEAEFSERYNINKIFVKTTQNFASNFDKDAFSKNYQLSSKVETYLDRGSEYVRHNLELNIAGVRHAILPRFFKQERLDISIRLEKLHRENDLLFEFGDLKKFDDYLYNTSEQDIYWLNFLAIDSNGTYYKVSNQILDVPSFFCIELIKTFKAATNSFQPWLNQALNFASLFSSIPIRKNERNNRALLLFAQILERRKVDPSLIFKHFKDLALCHWFKRYRGYSNIREPQIDNFDFAIKDGVFKYLGFLYVLQQLDLLQNRTTMKEENENVTSSNIAEDIQAFFSKLNYSPEQQALFYLGRALSQIAYAQEKKGHNKRILEKINFNGMDSRHITRLSTELFEKAMQHDVLGDAQWNLAEFNRRFNPEHWNLNPQEATFYLLSGYTYGIKTKNN